MAKQSKENEMEHQINESILVYGVPSRRVNQLSSYLLPYQVLENTRGTILHTSNPVTIFLLLLQHMPLKKNDAG